MSRPKVVLGVTIDDSLQYLRDYPAYLLAKGWDVHIASTPGPRLAELERLPGITTHPIPMVRDPSPARDLRALFRWVRMLRSVRPQAISVGTPKASLVGLAAAVLARVPVRVYLIRGLRLEASRGLGRRLLVAIERFTIRCSTETLAVSHSLRERALELGLARADRIEVLGPGSSNGVDTQEFSRENFDDAEIAAVRSEYGITPGVPVIGLVGRLTRDKGLFVLADACDILAERAIPVQLLILGAVDDESGADAVARLRELSQNVVITGHVGRPALFYQTMDILCVPSFREGFVNVALEAASSEVPVVASDAIGVIDTVQNDVGGLVVPVGDVAATATAIATLAGDDDQRRRMGRAGREWVVSNYQRVDVQQRYAAHLARALEKRTGIRVDVPAP
jgi:glycosyltransferase involved in cell wall biosynthesis